MLPYAQFIGENVMNVHAAQIVNPYLKDTLFSCIAQGEVLTVIQFDIYGTIGYFGMC